MDSGLFGGVRTAPLLDASEAASAQSDSQPDVTRRRPFALHAGALRQLLEEDLGASPPTPVRSSPEARQAGVLKFYSTFSGRGSILAIGVPTGELRLCAGIRFGAVSVHCVGDWPKHVWAVDDSGEVYEAKLGHDLRRYHGYRLACDDGAMREWVIDEWSKRTKGHSQTAERV